MAVIVGGSATPQIVGARETVDGMLRRLGVRAQVRRTKRGVEYRCVVPAGVVGTPQNVVVTHVQPVGWRPFRRVKRAVKKVLGNRGVRIAAKVAPAVMPVLGPVLGPLAAPALAASQGVESVERAKRWAKGDFSDVKAVRGVLTGDPKAALDYAKAQVQDVLAKKVLPRSKSKVVRNVARAASVLVAAEKVRKKAGAKAVKLGKGASKVVRAALKSAVVVTTKSGRKYRVEPL